MHNLGEKAHYIQKTSKRNWQEREEIFNAILMQTFNFGLYPYAKNKTFQWCTALTSNSWPFENWRCFFSCQQRYYYQRYSHAEKAVWSTEITLPELASRGGHIERQCIPVPQCSLTKSEGVQPSTILKMSTFFTQILHSFGEKMPFSSTEVHSMRPQKKHCAYPPQTDTPSLTTWASSLTTCSHLNLWCFQQAKIHPKWQIKTPKDSQNTRLMPESGHR